MKTHAKTMWIIGVLLRQYTLCMRKNKNIKITSHLEDVDCKNCLKVINEGYVSSWEGFKFIIFVIFTLPIIKLLKTKVFKAIIIIILYPFFYRYRRMKKNAQYDKNVKGEKNE